MDKQLIKSVKISKLWGIKDITTDFNRDVNIFIGANGTSKTTFLNLIESVMLVDFQTLSNIEFDSIEILLQNNETENRICVTKQHEDYPILSYRFNSEEPLAFPIPYSDIARNAFRRPVRFQEVFREIKEKLDKFVNISWLSVHRDKNQDEFDRMRERNRNYVDERLDELMKKLTVYQLQLESEASKVADKFKEDVFSLMLYNQDYDKVDIQNLQQFNPDSIKAELFKTFKALGVNLKDKTEIIQLHIKKLEEVVDIVKNKKTLTIENVFPLSLVNRTISLISISKDNENTKQNIFKPISIYLDFLKKFISNKEFKLDKESSGELEFRLKDKNSSGRKLPLFSLSSGEKQLVILFTETLLQRNEPFLFIADEPELSLHIEWQRMIIETLRGLNPNAQIIVATHSPEIAGKWKSNVVNMENITHYE
jgi:predicted ATPase